MQPQPRVSGAVTFSTSREVVTLSLGTCRPLLSLLRSEKGFLILYKVQLRCPGPALPRAGGSGCTAPALPEFCPSLVPAWESQTALYNPKEKPFCECELFGNKTWKGTAANKSKLITSDNKTLPR